ncbi:Hypothetical_protein [Hexamita inflata]|uniref:Hypothetical_protein n=1 Tax=Hexamita inflata TaxID=28002 RepID=A0AA86RE98_9EUKA|nr:Hypothetical protein HINF_LOCUS60131 [Hexamita inflata]
MIDINEWQKKLYQFCYIKQIRKIVDEIVCEERFYDLVWRYNYFEYDIENGTIAVSEKLNKIRQDKFNMTLPEKIMKCDYDKLIKTIEKHKEGLYERLVQYVKDNKMNECLLQEYIDRTK